MSAIPINPSDIANAGSFTAGNTAYPISVTASPREGAKAMSMQFKFDQKPGWLVQFPGVPNTPMSQIACLYVDAANSQFDVTIYFPDSGYSVLVNALGSRMIPVISASKSNGMPSFFVLLNSNNQLTSDVVNVIACNTFIPEFSANELTNVLSYGYGEFYLPRPTFTQSRVFFTQANITTTAPVTLILANQWYITALFVSAAVNTTVANTPSIIFKDGANIILRKTFGLTNAGAQAIDLFDNTGMQLLSNTTGNLTAEISDVTGWVGSAFNFSVMGGILIP